MSRLTDVLFKQGSKDIRINIPSGSNLSTEFFTEGMRGLAVLVPSAWTSAEIAFAFLYGPVTQLLKDDTGTLVTISGINTSASFLYIAPSAVWALGAAPKCRLVSVNASGAAVNQAANRELKVFRLY